MAFLKDGYANCENRKKIEVFVEDGAAGHLYIDAVCSFANNAFNRSLDGSTDLVMPMETDEIDDLPETSEPMDIGEGKPEAIDANEKRTNIFPINEIEDTRLLNQAFKIYACNSSKKPFSSKTPQVKHTLEIFLPFAERLRLFAILE